MKRGVWTGAVGAVLALALGSEARAYDPANKSIVELEADLAAGRTTSVELVALYENRIAALNPRLHAVIAVNPLAPAQAAAADALRRSAGPAGPPGGLPLLGLPILIKDNIETADPTPTTAGSLALRNNLTGRDAPLVAKLRRSGAIILGKTNLSEWANIRSNHSLSGWSAVGGQTRNPYALDRSPCGSSAGSAVAAAAGLAVAAIGTETDGSVTCPAAINGLVGLKPTVGWVSRRFVVPISRTQDTPGPLTRSVADAALLMSVMAGGDPEDAATAAADARPADFAGGLSPRALSGVRIGVLRYASTFHPQTAERFEQALSILRQAGAVLVEIRDDPFDHALGRLEHRVLMTELKADLNAYLAATSPDQVASRSLSDLIAFNREHAEAEMPFFAQESFEDADKTQGLADADYLAAKSAAFTLAGPEGIDKVLSDNQVAALVAPTLAPAWLIDPVLKDHFVGGGVGQAPAIAGYPHLTVPMGQVDGLPVGLSFIGPAWSDRSLLAYGFAFEQARPMGAAPAYPASVAATPAVGAEGRER